MSELTIENWNDLISSIGSIADKSQGQLVQINNSLRELNNTIMFTNIILSVLAISFIVFLIIKVLEYRNR